MSRNGGSEFDYDWIVVGSGFGGSVSALRLSEKGYRVGVIEAGRRFGDEDFATTTWHLRRFLWAPAIGLRGILRFTVFKDVIILSGCGVGGGSLVYANTLYVPPRAFFQAADWRDLADWQEELAPHYEEAKRMLGAVEIPFETDADRLVREVGADLGVADTYGRPTVSVYFGQPGRTDPDPFFGGAGPARTGCVRCGSCMVGCRHNAKNTLVKNYLWLAERLGTRVESERTVIDVRPLGDGEGHHGYAVTSVRSGAWYRKQRETVTARGVVLAAGAVGTNLLLRRCKEAGSLPNLSERLGEKVRGLPDAVVAPDDHPARDADPRQRAAPAAGPSGADRVPPDRAGPRQPQLHIHTGSEPRRGGAGQADGRNCAEQHRRGALQHPSHRAHPRRGGDRAGPEHGVVDQDQKVFGYECLLVCDGSVVPANPGVNPSLTITALAEHAMAAVPHAGTPARPKAG